MGRRHTHKHNSTDPTLIHNQYGIHFANRIPLTIDEVVFGFASPFWFLFLPVPLLFFLFFRGATDAPCLYLHHRGGYFHIKYEIDGTE